MHYAKSWYLLKSAKVNIMSLENYFEKLNFWGFGEDEYLSLEYRIL